MSWSLQLHTGKLRLNGARSHIWGIHVCLTPLPLPDPKRPALSALGGGRARQNQGTILSSPATWGMSCYTPLVCHTTLLPNSCSEADGDACGVPMPRANPPSGSDLCGGRTACLCWNGAHGLLSLGLWLFSLTGMHCGQLSSQGIGNCFL